MTNFLAQALRLPLFEGVAEETTRALMPLMQRDYPDGRTLFSQGSNACALTAIIHGSVRIEADGIYLATRGAGEVVGEQAFIGGHAHTASALAQGHVRALCLPCDTVQQLMKDAAFTSNLLKMLSGKLQQATEDRALRYAIEHRLFSEFEAHTSPDVTQRLLQSGKNYGRPRYIQAALLMADIRSFTDRSATLEPDDIAAQLSPYLDAVVEIIHRHGGMVDKFIGDAVLAVWGYEQEDENSLDSKQFEEALACAKQMIETARQFHFAGTPIQIGVGLNAGRVFIGNIGGAGKRQFTVLGTPVNLTARFESETKNLAPIVVGSDFYAHLPAHEAQHFTPHPDYPIKGALPMTIYSHQAGQGASS